MIWKWSRIFLRNTHIHTISWLYNTLSFRGHKPLFKMGLLTFQSHPFFIEQSFVIHWMTFPLLKTDRRMTIVSYSVKKLCIYYHILCHTISLHANPIQKTLLFVSRSLLFHDCFLPKWLYKNAKVDHDITQL